MSSTVSSRINSTNHAQHRGAASSSLAQTSSMEDDIIYGTPLRAGKSETFFSIIYFLKYLNSQEVVRNLLSLPPPPPATLASKADTLGKLFVLAPSWSLAKESATHIDSSTTGQLIRIKSNK